MVSRITAMIVASNEVDVTWSGPHDNGKYSGFIQHKASKYSRVLISSEPVFETQELAISGMEKVVENCKKLMEKEQ